MSPQSRPENPLMHYVASFSFFCLSAAFVSTHDYKYHTMAQLIPNIYSDLDLNFTPHPTKKDVPRLIDADAVKRSVRMLVLTKHHERLFHPEIGCDATQLLFEPVTPITAINLKRSIEDVINNFEPRARLKNVIVNLNPDTNSYTASIEFFIANNPKSITLSVILERVR